jgi:hypothetical protein
MELTRKTDKNGVTTTTNWILDQVIDTLNEYGISNEGTENDALIKKLTIEKFEYARTCMRQVMADFILEDKDISKYINLDYQIQNQIKSLGGKPTQILNLKK